MMLIFIGRLNAITEMKPEVSAAAPAARSLRFGSIIAMKVSGTAKSNDQDSGIFKPTMTPITVPICQRTYRGMAQPR